MSEVTTMEAILIGTAVVGSFAGAFVVQKAVLEAWLRAIDPTRRAAKL
jgi:hypothetical protein